MQYIYSRVSTEKQAAENQTTNLLKLYPQAEVIEEVATSSKTRPILNDLISRLMQGDTLIIAALDRLGRRLVETVTLIEELHARGIALVSVREGLDYSTPAGKLVIQVICAVAELERNIISERTKAALQAKKNKGIKLGRKHTYGAETRAEIKRLCSLGLSYAETARRVGVSPAQVGRIEKE